ncbi:MAG: lipid-binding SYLF domain-containing protein [Syntrophobacteraceae bacterium]|nr:lipid-binding SYLF domain-containing protein [Syntrophobacteraceae bacterium]
MAKRGIVAVFTVVLGFWLLPCGLAKASVSTEAKVHASIAVVKETMDIPENAIPPYLLEQAHAIAIFPDLLKGGFLLAGSYGLGVVVEKNSYGKWGNPVFFHIVGASFGFQAGVQSTDGVLIFKSIRSVQKLYEGRITLGADASIAVGPVGRQANADTDILLRSEILSYSRSRGLFGGVSFEGAVIQMDYAATADFYNQPGLLPAAILQDENVNAPPVARELDRVLDWYSSH